ncbi:MAG: DUF3303 domain-containing protein [Bryobacteraceae bacterium]
MRSVCDRWLINGVATLIANREEYYAPPEGAKPMGRWHAAAGSGGVTVFESDDATAIARWCQDWTISW